MFETDARHGIIRHIRWRVGGAVTRRSAKPQRWVQLPYVPPYKLQEHYWYTRTNAILSCMPKRRSWTDNQLMAAVKESCSYRAVIDALGLVPAGGNYTQVQARVQALRIATDHFTGSRWNAGKTYHTSSRPELTTLLKEGSGVQSYKLKRRLFEAGLKKPKCELCGWAQEASDGRVPVELDHVNGVHTDNRLENLRVLCPNCHSLQSTHRGKNKKVRFARVMER